MNIKVTNINFGVRNTVGPAKKKRIARRIISEAKNMYGKNCPHLLIGKTNYGNITATVTINTNKGTVYVEPEYLTNDVLRKLSKFFRKDK